MLQNATASATATVVVVVSAAVVFSVVVFMLILLLGSFVYFPLVFSLSKFREHVVSWMLPLLVVAAATHRCIIIDN